MAVLLLIIAIFLFFSLVVVHEFGHYLAARRNGVEVEEFAIGFPPRIWSKKLKNNTLFSLNLLPIGGYVKLKGENDSNKKKGSFGVASLKTKIKIMTAGVGMNLLVAYLLLTFLALVGIPKVIDNQFSIESDTKVIKNEIFVGGIEEGSPAEMAGLEISDQILSINGGGEVNCLALNCPKTAGEINSAEQLPNLTKQLAGKNVIVTYKRDGKTNVKQVQLRTNSEVEKSKKTDNPKGYLGISPSQYTLQRSTWSAPIVAGGLIGQVSKETLKGLWHALSNLVTGHTSEASKQVAGPVGIFVLLKDGSVLGYQFMLFIIAIISLTLALINVLPIPALDGGRLFVTLLFRALKKPLNKKTEELIHGTGFALLMLLFVLITIVDIRRF